MYLLMYVGDTHVGTYTYLQSYGYILICLNYANQNLVDTPIVQCLKIWKKHKSY